ncbi:MAG TPA: hypothetical protein DCG28_04100 [Lachnospiraceae bacterium]|nr:hypothetical protein [Lachnospiraceae bacterium]
MFCEKCGKELPADAMFCHFCGTAVTPEQPQNTYSARASGYGAPQPQYGAQQQGYYQNPQQNYGMQGQQHFGSNNGNSAPLWYYYLGNVRKGPVSEKQIEDFVRDGVLERDSMVWREGFSEWLKIENTAFMSFIQQRPALSDKWLWTLATVPLLVNFMLLKFIPEAGSTPITIIVIVLNTIFFLLDVNYLRENGVDAGAWMWLGLVLIPVYLFVRASKTTKNWGPGIVYTVLFVLSLFAQRLTTIF